MVMRQWVEIIGIVAKFFSEDDLAKLRARKLFAHLTVMVELLQRHESAATRPHYTEEDITMLFDLFHDGLRFWFQTLQIFTSLVSAPWLAAQCLFACLQVRPYTIVIFLHAVLDLILWIRERMAEYADTPLAVEHNGASMVCMQLHEHRNKWYADNQGHSNGTEAFLVNMLKKANFSEVYLAIEQVRGGVEWYPGSSRLAASRPTSASTSSRACGWRRTRRTCCGRRRTWGSVEERSPPSRSASVRSLGAGGPQSGCGQTRTSSSSRTSRWASST